EVLGFYSDDFFFLLGVAITWALAGRRLDRRNFPQGKGKKATAVALAISVLLVGMAVLLFFLAKHDFVYRVNPAPNIAPFLALTWSISLIYVAARQLLRLRQGGRQGPEERPDPCVRGILGGTG